MNKFMKKFVSVWLISVVAFNVIAFAVPAAANLAFSNSFWIAYASIMIGFIGTFVCIRMVIKSESADRMFLNLPIVSVSVIGLIILVAAGTVFVVVPAIPYWISILVSVLVIAISAVMVINTTAASETVEKVHETSQKSQETIRALTAKVKVMAEVETDYVIKKEYTRIYEVLRFSDPVSSSSLIQIEDEIEAMIAELKNIEEIESLKKQASEVLRLIKERNEMCKVMKSKS